MHGRSKVPDAAAKEISRRLRLFVAGRHQSWAQFCKELEIPRTTASAWIRPKASVPDPKFLLILARKTGISLDWLLLGKGENSSPTERVRRILEAEWTADGRALEFPHAWSTLVKDMLPKDRNIEDFILQVAAGALRKTLSEARDLHRILNEIEEGKRTRADAGGT